MASSAETAVPDIARPRNDDPAWRRERTFFAGIAVAVALTVFVGFAPTFYLHSALASSNTLTTSLIVHGVAFTAWIVLLVVQTSLIAARRVQMHRALGYAGAVLGAVIVLVGGFVTIDRAKHGLFVPPEEGVPVEVFLTVPLASLVVFPVLLGAAVYLRRQAAAHKRLMLIATFELMTAAVGRWPVIAAWGVVGAFCVTDLFLAAIAIHDYSTLKRIHPATLWGGSFLLVSQVLRLAIGGTAAWITFAHGLIT